MSGTRPGTGVESNVDAFRPGGWNARHVLTLLLLLGSSEFAVLVSLFPVNALPQIGEHYQTSQVAWIPAVITLGGVLSPLIGKMADRYGKKRIMVALLLLGTVGLLISAFAPNYTVMMIGRVIQAPVSAVGFMIPSIVRDVFPTRIIAFGMMVAATGASLITVGAQLFVGTILEHFTFRGTFWIPAIVGAVVAVLMMIALPESGVRDPSGKMDAIGALLLGGGFGIVLLGVSFGPMWGWLSTPVIGAFALGAIVLVGWVLQARRTAEPVIDLKHLASTPIVMVLIIAGIVASLSGWFYALLPIVTLQPAESGWGLGLDPTQHGYIAAIWSLGGACGGLVGGFLLGRLSGPKVLLSGVALMASAYLIALLGLQSVPLVTVAAFCIGAAGSGSVAACMYLMMRQVPAHRQATMSSVVTLAYGLFSAAVPVVLFAVMNALGSPDANAGVVAYSSASVLSAIIIPVCITAAGILCAMALWRTLPRSAAEPLRSREKVEAAAEA